MNMKVQVGSPVIRMPGNSTITPFRGSAGKGVTPPSLVPGTQNPAVGTKSPNGLPATGSTSGTVVVPGVGVMDSSNVTGAVVKISGLYQMAQSQLNHRVTGADPRALLPVTREQLFFLIEFAKGERDFSPAEWMQYRSLMAKVDKFYEATSTSNAPLAQQRRPALTLNQVLGSALSEVEAGQRPAYLQALKEQLQARRISDPQEAAKYIRDLKSSPASKRAITTRVGQLLSPQTPMTMGQVLDRAVSNLPAAQRGAFRQVLAERLERSGITDPQAATQFIRNLMNSPVSVAEDQKRAAKLLTASPSNPPADRPSGSKPDLPNIPAGADHTEAGLAKLLKTAGDRMLQQRVEDYRSGRTTRDEATRELDDPTKKAKVNAWLDAIDRSRMSSRNSSGGQSAGRDFPAVKASKNIAPDGQAGLRNAIAKGIVAASGGKVGRGEAVQLANLIVDKYHKEADALKIADITGELLKAGQSVERIAYALTSSVRHSKLFRHIAGSPEIGTRAQADAFIQRCVEIKELPKEQQAQAVSDLIAGRTVPRASAATQQENATAATTPTPTKKAVPIAALDTSTWGLPMGERGSTFFGEQRVPSKYLPSTTATQSGTAEATKSGRAKSFEELQASLLGSNEEDRNLTFLGNNWGTTKAGSRVHTPNERFALELFKNERSVAKHFVQRTLADRPGQSPTSFAYGGHAAQGPFSNITGKTYTEIAKKVLLRVEALVKSGVLVKIGSGGTNGVYLHKPTQQIIRVGRISCNELHATAGFSKIGNKGVGAKIDLSQSLYLPSELLFAAKTEGFAVLFMEHVPGMRLQGNAYLLSPSAKAKIAPAAADALVAIHMNNKSHGDFGPHNINVTATGEVRVIDFDLSGPQYRAAREDLEGLESILEELYPSSKNQSRETIQGAARKLYQSALDRLVGPDRNSEIYKKHPELYDAHLARFKAKKAALKKAVSQYD